MTRSRRLTAAAGAIAFVLAFLLAACAGLPLSGPVHQGPQRDEETDVPLTFVPAGPRQGASPQEIVEGFVRAGTGTTGGWARAREFLAPSFADQWHPTEGVIVDAPLERSFAETAEDAVSATFVRVGSVDSTGAYSPDEEDMVTLEFRLEQQDDGEWRIIEAPDGVVLGRDVFPRVFNAYEVTYFDPTWTYLVPDVRWYPITSAPVRIAQALVSGTPSPWLAESVVTAFPETVQLEPASVPVVSGVAQVSLSENALDLDTQTASRMLAQLEASLEGARVTEVELSVASTPIEVDAATTQPTRVGATPLVLTADGFGYLAGAELSRIRGISDVVEELVPTAVQVGVAAELAALRLSTGEVVRAEASGRWNVIDDRADLVDPTIDPFGWVLSVPRTNPAAVTATSADGEIVAVADAWPGASEVTAMSVSRDGARVAVAAVIGARSELWVAGIVRDEDERPVRLGAPIMIGELAAAAPALTWLDDVTVGAVVPVAEESIVQQPVGGPVSSVAAPEGASSLAGTTPLSAIRVRSDDGSLWARRGTTWAVTASDVLVLATQQGAPG